MNVKLQYRPHEDAISLTIKGHPDVPKYHDWEDHTAYKKECEAFWDKFLKQYGIIGNVFYAGSYCEIEWPWEDGDIAENARDALLSVKENHDRNFSRH